MVCQHGREGEKKEEEKTHTAKTSANFICVPDILINQESSIAPPRSPSSPTAFRVVFTPAREQLLQYAGESERIDEEEEEVY